MYCTRITNRALTSVTRHGTGLVATILLCAAGVTAAEDGWIAFAEGEQRPSMAVAVGDTPGVALLHTIMPSNAVSASFAERAGIGPGERSFPIPGGQGTASEAEPFVLAFADTEMQATDFVIVPDDMARADMVFGRPLFEGALIQLDYPNRRLRILPAEGAGVDGNVRLRRSEYGRPMVETRIDGKRAWMLVDTSSRGLCTLKRTVVVRRNWDEHAIAAEQLSELEIDFDDSMQPMLLDGFELGPYKFGAFIAAYSPEGKHTIDARELTNDARRQIEHFEADGLLGHEVLRNFIVTLNLSDDMVHFYAP